MVVLDVEADSVSREAYIFAPIYRVRMTEEQFKKLYVEVNEKWDELNERKADGTKVNLEMRDIHFRATGTYASDEDILEWWNNK